MKIIILMVFFLLSGCSLNELLGYNFKDPNKALAIMQIKRGELHMAIFDGLDGQKLIGLADVYYVNNGCQVLALPVDAGRYKLKEVSSHSATNALGYTTGHTSYHMKSSPSKLEFTAKSGEVIFLGSYELEGSAKSFTLEKTRACGSEKDAWLAFEKNQLNHYPDIYDPVWTERVKKRIATLR